MCYGTINSQNINGCNCPEPLTEHNFQKKRYNEVLAQKNNTIKEMQSEMRHLRKIIISLTKTSRSIGNR